jgi:hypothetical protein
VCKIRNYDIRKKEPFIFAAIKIVKEIRINLKLGYVTMKLKRLFFISGLLVSIVMLLSCFNSQKIHHPAGKKKKNRDCDCHKWSNNQRFITPNITLYEYERG